MRDPECSIPRQTLWYSKKKAKAATIDQTNGEGSSSHEPTMNMEDPRQTSPNLSSNESGQDSDPSSTNVESDSNSCNDQLIEPRQNLDSSFSSSNTEKSDEESDFSSDSRPLGQFSFSSNEEHDSDSEDHEPQEDLDRSFSSNNSESNDSPSSNDNITSNPFMKNDHTSMSQGGPAITQAPHGSNGM